MVYIDILLFGEMGRYKNELNYINKIKSENKSEIFTINDINNVFFSNNYELNIYSKSELIKFAGDYLNVKNSVICFIDSPLEGNYFRKKLTDNSSVISFYQTRELYNIKGHSIDKFILRHIYKTAIRHMLNNCVDIKRINLRPHKNTEGCLYDFCSNKNEVVISADKLRPLCRDCELKLNAANLPNGFIDLLKKELSNIAIQDIRISIEEDYQNQTLSKIHDNLSSILKVVEDIDKRTLNLISQSKAICISLNELENISNENLVILANFFESNREAISQLKNDEILNATTEIVQLINDNNKKSLAKKISSLLSVLSSIVTLGVVGFDVISHPPVVEFFQNSPFVAVF
jgi:hypothetical protein